VYIIEKAIPLYQDRKAIGYQEAIRDFSMDEMANAHSNLKCWSEFKKVTDTDLVLENYGAGGKDTGFWINEKRNANKHKPGQK